MNTNEHEGKAVVMRTTKITVLPAAEPIYSEMATDVAIDDEAAGEYVTVEQHGNGMGKIAITPEEWPALRTAINRMVRQCKEVPSEP